MQLVDARIRSHITPVWTLIVWKIGHSIELGADVRVISRQRDAMVAEVIRHILPSYTID